MTKENMTLSASQSNKTFYVENLGCSKNQVDAETIISALKKSGWTYSSSADEAGLIIVNTCGFIQSAKEESIETIFDFKQLYPNKKVLAAGCFAQRYNEDLLTMIPELDGVFGNKAPGEVFQIVDEVVQGKRPVFMPKEHQEGPLRDDFFNYKGSAFVKIAEGCNNRCKFCAIPLIKGDLESRTIDSILTEIKDLLDKKVFEINLVAQDLAGFGTDRGQKELLSLIKQISALKGNFWLRLLYIHPDKFPLELLELMKEDSRILPYFDIPFQHGDQGILKAMGRKGNRKIYLDLIKKIREAFPMGVIRSSIMAGFPGENSKTFSELKLFLEEAKLDWAGFFTYSREEGTEAYNYRGALATKLVQKKAQKQRSQLEELQQKISEKQMDKFVGQELVLLVEEEVEGEPLYLTRSYFQAPEVDGLVVLRAENLEQGSIVRARVIKRNGLDLEAVLLDGEN